MKTLWFLLFAIILAGVLYFLFTEVIPVYFPGIVPKSEGAYYVADIGGKTFKLEIAKTPEKRDEGLGDRDSMPEGEGMIFLLDSSEGNAMWMKGMRFPLDVVWIYGKKVVDIMPNVKTEPLTAGKDLTVYRPVSPTDIFIELNAGEVAKTNLHVGDSISWE